MGEIQNRQASPGANGKWLSMHQYASTLRVLRVLIGSAVEEICSGSLVGVNNTDSKEAQRPKLLETRAVGRVQGYKKISRSILLTKYGSSTLQGPESQC